MTELLTGPIAIIVYMYVGLWIWETAAPGKELPAMPYWKIKGVLFFSLNLTLSLVYPLLIDKYLIEYQLFDLTGLHAAIQVLIGVFAYQFVFYLWHRALHNSDFLWKVFHQMHHSTERLDIPSSYITSPVDTIGFTTVGSIVFVLIIGLNAETATLSLLILTFIDLFQHANVKTPRWLGYIIERPESHSIHHGRGIHRYNYAGIPLIDMIFGTFRNPKDFSESTGFYDGASARIGEMLVFKDVSQPKEK